ncbi:MAG: hypothetical protein QXJ02_02295 [Candidatus Bathyarchaeia archaeon]
MTDETENMVIRRKIFFKIASHPMEYLRDAYPTEELLRKMREKKIDIFTFIERKWCSTVQNPSPLWLKANDNIALLKIETYDKWLKDVGKKTRNMIRKAEKSGVRTEIAEPNEKLAEGIWKIYNETPIRQERGFPHYGISMETVRRIVLSSRESTFIGAYFNGDLGGFVQLVHGDNITVISQILSLQKHWDKAINNALVARAVEFCAGKGVRWLMYGRMGNHPTLDKFKQNNGCVFFPLTRSYVVLSRKGRIAARLNLHREFKDVLPQSMKTALFPIYNWVSRNKMRVKLLLKGEPVSFRGA